MPSRYYERGATLVVVLLCLLIFMVMIMGFTFDARSQSVLNAGVKLHNYYRVSGEQVLNDVRANLADYWVQTTTAGGIVDKDTADKWRFGSLLQGDFSLGGAPSEYGILFSEGSLQQNAGILDLDYKVYVANNADDASFYLTGVQPVDGLDLTIDQNWDTDGKIVMTVQIFQSGDAMPLSTVSHLIAVSGWDFIQSAGNVGSEGSNYEQDNTGRGSMGQNDTLDLFEDVNQDMTAWLP